MATDYVTFNTSHTAYSLANKVRGLVETLCNPIGSSQQFPDIAETIVEDRFIGYCSRWFCDLIGVDEAQDADLLHWHPVRTVGNRRDVARTLQCSPRGDHASGEAD